MTSHEIASADSLLREVAELRGYIERLRRWGTRLLNVIDTHPDLIPIYASSLKWRIDGPPPPVETDDPTEVAELRRALAVAQAELEAARKVVEHARWSVERKDFAYVALRDSVATYDEAVKARAE